MTSLEQILWIGGGSGTGKTTLTTAPRRHGLRWYSADAHTWEHPTRHSRRGTRRRREFRCECDDPECNAVVPITVAEYAPGPSAHG
jgi:hypothetical protein